MPTNWMEQIDNQERRMSVATMFLNNLVEGDVQIPDEAIELSEQALKDLTHHGAMLSTIQRKLADEADPDKLMAQPSIQKAWNEIVSATDKILEVQGQMIQAADEDLINIVSQDEMESMKGSPLTL